MQFSQSSQQQFQLSLGWTEAFCAARQSVLTMGIFILGASAQEREVQAILTVSCTIFEIDPTHEPREAPADIQEWMLRLVERNGEIVFHRNDSSNEVTAFVFTFRRSADPSQLHIWIAGCSSNYRRKGIMNTLFETVEQRAVIQGYSTLTVNTYPEKFVNMPSFLTSRQYEIISTNPGTKEPGDLGTKLGFAKTIVC